MTESAPRKSLASELQRRNVLKVGAAYAVVAWLLIQVAATVAPQLGLPEWAPRLRELAAGIERGDAETKRRQGTP